jgi:hypothetical protein
MLCDDSMWICALINRKCNTHLSNLNAATYIFAVSWQRDCIDKNRTKSDCLHYLYTFLFTNENLQRITIKTEKQRYWREKREHTPDPRYMWIRLSAGCSIQRSIKQLFNQVQLAETMKSTYGLLGCDPVNSIKHLAPFGRNFGKCLPDYTALNSTRRYYSL